MPVLLTSGNFFLCRGSKKRGRFRGSYGYFPYFMHVFAWYDTISLQLFSFQSTYFFLHFVRLLLTCVIIACLGYCLVCGPFIAYTVVHDWSIIVIISLLINVIICENVLLAIHGLFRLTFYWCNRKVRSYVTLCMLCRH